MKEKKSLKERMLLTPTFTAKQLCALGYQKLPEDSVVISREEYEIYDVVKKGYPNDMSCLAEKLTEISHNSYKKGSKETAEKIIGLIKTFCPDKKFVEVITRIISERLGVEIKE